MQNRHDRKPHRRRSHPFWLPASTFYFLATAIAIGIFFLVWAILNDGRDSSPWITAGLVSSVSMIVAVVIREGILRNRRANIYAAQRRLDNSVLSVPLAAKKDTDPDRLTLERNALLLDEIVRKSEAAKVLSNLSESHRQVFQLCDAYIETARRELPLVGVGSPRLAAIRRGRDKAERIHKFHMLKWAEIEARSNTQAAGIAESPAAKLEKVKTALSVVEFTAQRYPDNRSIIDSREVLEQLVRSIRGTGSGETAEGSDIGENLGRELSESDGIVVEWDNGGDTGSEFDREPRRKIDSVE